MDFLPFSCEITARPGSTEHFWSDSPFKILPCVYLSGFPSHTTPAPLNCTRTSDQVHHRIAARELHGVHPSICVKLLFFVSPVAILRDAVVPQCADASESHRVYQRCAAARSNARRHPTSPCFSISCNRRGRASAAPLLSHFSPFR